MLNILMSSATATMYTMFILIGIGALSYLLWRSIKKTYLKEKEEKRMHIDGVISKGEMNSYVSAYISKDSGESMFSLIYIDLDKFDDFEIAFGKKEAQNIAKSVAKTIKDELPKQTIISRYAGDDFMIFLPRQYNRNDVIEVAESILKSFRNKITLRGDIEIDLTASIAVAQYPNHGTSINHLLQSLQLSIHNIKKDGGNALKVYSKSLESEEEEMNYYYQIKRAISEKQFMFYYQPMIDLETNEIYAYESLLRWEHPELGVLSPNRFINVMEQTGDIHWVGEWGLETLIKKHFELKEINKKAPLLAINLSPKQLLNPHIAEGFQKIIRKYKVNANNFILEIGEFLIFDKQPIILENLIKLKKSNFILAIDEFGIDIASFDQIEKMGIDLFKIDSSFIEDDSYSINKYMEYFMDYVKKNEKDVICQGVENGIMERRAKSFGIGKMQGYYYSKPMDGSRINNFEYKTIDIVEEQWYYIDTNVKGKTRAT